MSEKNKQEKIQRFLADNVMSESVYEVLRAAFTKTRTYKAAYPDVNFLAAERIAADLLEEAWNELQRIASKTEAGKKEPTQIGM